VAAAVNLFRGDQAVLSGEVRFQINKDRIRKHFLKYTRKAFRMLPKLDKPRILDVGCGSGVPTMELARMSNGEITGLDIDDALLDVLRSKIKKAGVSDRVKAVKCSIFDMEFPDNSFDIIWAEGSISVAGFERGLREWKRFLKPAGFMVVHDEKSNIETKLKQISNCGYEPLGYFILNEDIWWTEYCVPLEKLIAETRTRYADDPKVLEELHNAQREIDMFKKNPKLNSSAIFVMKRNQ
jgi:ubiquinone/menaquinone biosynthesis C-methylase UbiE